MRLCLRVTFLLFDVLLDSVSNLLLCYHLLLSRLSGLFLFLLFFMVVAFIEKLSDSRERRTFRLIFFLRKPVCVTNLWSIRSSMATLKTTQAMLIKS